MKNKDIKLGEVKYEVKLDRSKIRNLCTLDVGVLNVYIDDKLYTSVSLKISEKTIWDDGSDCYSSIHYFA